MKTSVIIIQVLAISFLISRVPYLIMDGRNQISASQAALGKVSGAGR